ncbi:hypothetical protein BGZ89_011004 [Linnemannia elongata]|nr:hypothetical protein BGZ89_011004 [Linnemannia elongata]
MARGQETWHRSFFKQLAQQTEALPCDDKPGVTKSDTTTSSNDNNQPQPTAVQEPTPIVSSDFTQTSVSASLGDKDAQVALGDMYKVGQGVQQDYKAAMEWYLRAAKQGGAVGQRKVGVLYDLGHGVTQDYSIALTWYLKSADQGNAQAQSNIGTFYCYGYGVPLDCFKAMK